MPGLIQESVIPDEAASPQRAVSRPARQARVVRLMWWLRTNAILIAGVLLLGMFVLAAAIGPILDPHPDSTIYPLSILQAPTRDFPFGTDDLGRDVLSRILSGMRVSLAIGLGSITGSLLVGALLGMLCGYLGEVVDALIMRLMDIIVAFPAMLLAIALMTMLGASLLNVGLAIAIIYVPIFARVMRGSVIAVRNEQYVEAVRAVGAGPLRVMFRHILPNSISTTIVQTSLAISDAILVEAALSYLGLSVAPPTPSLGSMLTEGQGFMTMDPWVVVFPGFALVLGVLGFNLVGDSLRDMLDPHSRGI